MSGIKMMLLMLVTLFACKQKAPLEASEMKAIMWDLALVDEFASNFLQRDTTLDAAQETRKRYAEVFALHNISKESFTQSLRWYQSHPDDYKILLDSLNAYANRQREAQFMQNYAADSTLQAQ